MVYIMEKGLNRYNKNIIYGKKYDYFLFDLICELLHILNQVIG